jgi:hypothetical protein
MSVRKRIPVRICCNLLVKSTHPKDLPSSFYSFLPPNWLFLDGKLKYCLIFSQIGNKIAAALASPYPGCKRHFATLLSGVRGKFRELPAGSLPQRLRIV